MITGTYYLAPKPTQELVIYAIGAPIKPDTGDLPDAPLILKKGIDVFVPDYIGFGRSLGKFTPKNCIKTLIICYDHFEKKYKRIYLVGRSLGGAYVPLLPHWRPQINKICLLYPAVDQKSQGEVEGEETNEWFVEALAGEYSQYYKKVSKGIWWRHVNGLDGLSPMDNISYLSKAKVFIGHGKKDKCINYIKTKRYFKKIGATFPDKKSQFKLNIYKEGDHGPSTSNNAIKDFLNWIR